MKRNIKKVAVIGSGIMGSGIACHFANIGVQVLLLDIIPKDADSSKKSRNKIMINTSHAPDSINDINTGFVNESIGMRNKYAMI